MISLHEANFIAVCLEGFFYGLYSGIFAMYLQCSSNKSRTAIIYFYAPCLLYVLSTATFVSDFVTLMPWHMSMMFRLYIVQVIATSCCDFIAQCIMIYRCWIVWGQNIRVVIIPSFLAIAYLATCLAQSGGETPVQDQLLTTPWGDTVVLTSSALSMAVNTLTTGLIVFKILKVFLEANAFSVERTLSSTGGTKLRHIIFIIIESGMALFAIQLVRLVLLAVQSYNLLYVLPTGINQMSNGIAPTLILVRVSMKLSFDDRESFMETARSFCFNNPRSDSGPGEE